MIRFPQSVNKWYSVENDGMEQDRSPRFCFLKAKNVNNHIKTVYFQTIDISVFGCFVY